MLKKKESRHLQDLQRDPRHTIKQEHPATEGKSQFPDDHSSEMTLFKEGEWRKMTYASFNMKVNAQEKRCCLSIHLPYLNPKPTCYTCLLERERWLSTLEPWVEIIQQYQWIPFAVKGCSFTCNQRFTSGNIKIKPADSVSYDIQDHSCHLVQFPCTWTEGCKAEHKTQTLNQREITLNPCCMPLYFVTSQSYLFSKASW